MTQHLSSPPVAVPSELAEVSHLIEDMRRAAADLLDRTSSIAGLASAPLLPASGRLLRAQHLCAHRATRRMVFGDDADLFWDAAWDILLTLYVDGLRGRPVSVDGACDASGVAPTTALRHIGLLTERGMVVQIPHRYDRRVNHVSLTSRSWALMHDYIDRL